MSPLAQQQEQQQALLIRQLYVYCLQVLFVRNVAFFSLLADFLETSVSPADDEDSSAREIKQPQVKDEGTLGQLGSHQKEALVKSPKSEKPLMGSLLGQEYDPENELYYYNARYYDPSIGIFTTADTIIPDEYDPLSYNRYMYVRGNPINYIDPSGHFFWLIGLLIGVVVGAALGAATSYVVHGIQTGEWTGAGAARAAGWGAVAGAVGGLLGGVTALAGGFSAISGLLGGSAIVDYALVGAFGASACLAASDCSGIEFSFSGDLDRESSTLNNDGTGIANSSGGSGSGGYGDNNCGAFCISFSSDYEIDNSRRGRGLYDQNSLLNHIQRSLSGVGLIPGLGNIADVVNTGISVARGNYGDAAVNAFAAVPFVGLFATGGKFVGSTQTLIRNVTRSTSRVTRSGGRGVRLELGSGRRLDITKIRVKVKVLNVKNPGSGYSNIRFKNFLPGSKGFKRAPTERDLGLLDYFYK